MTINQHKRYPWIFLAGMFLILNVGYINAVVWLGFYHKAVSYMTGNIAMIGLELDNMNYKLALDFLGITLSFLAGAILNGILIGSHQFSLHHRYGLSLFIQAILTASGVVCLHFHFGKFTHANEYIIAMACGMQNAMTTVYSGAIIRTTHFTGVLTDLGIQIGHWIRRRSYEGWRILLFSVSLVTFCLGSMLGGIVYDYYKVESLWFCVIITSSLGLWFAVWRYGYQAEISENMK